MRDGSLAFVVLALLIIVGYCGFLFGRRSSENKEEVDRLKKELDDAHARAERVEAGISSHFEQTAVLFTQMSKDYRQFLDHFQGSAKELGLPDARAEELLDQVARPLLPASETVADRVVADAARREPSEAALEPARATPSEDDTHAHRAQAAGVHADDARAPEGTDSAPESASADDGRSEPERPSP